MRDDAVAASILLSLLLIIAVTGCQAAGSGPPSAANTGVLTGRVTRGPVAGGPARAGTADAAVAAGVEIRLRARDGGPGHVVRTDGNGVYRLSLPPGTYEVSIGPLHGMEFTKDVPATVDIARGRETRKDILIDTGVR